MANNNGTHADTITLIKTKFCGRCIAGSDGRHHVVEWQNLRSGFSGVYHFLGHYFHPDSFRKKGQEIRKTNALTNRLGQIILPDDFFTFITNNNYSFINYG